MKRPSNTVLAAGIIGFAGLMLAAIGAPTSRTPPTNAAEQSSPPPPSMVSVGGFALTSTSIDLPLDESRYPDAPHVDIINANCTSCHSAGMALTQPALSTRQ
jgi:hypothetical protein